MRQLYGQPVDQGTRASPTRGLGPFRTPLHVLMAGRSTPSLPAQALQLSRNTSLAPSRDPNADGPTQAAECGTGHSWL